MIINITGILGCGKSSVIKGLELPLPDTTIVDFKGDMAFKDSMNGAKFIYGDFQNPLNAIDILKNEILYVKPKTIIIDDADIIRTESKAFENLLLFAENLERETLIVIGSQEKIDSLSSRIEYFQMNDNRDIEKTIRLVKKCIQK